MDLCKELTRYFGFADNVSKAEILKIENKSDAYKQSVFDFLVENQQKNFGFPDVAMIKKALKCVPAESNSTRKFVYAICMECKEKYDYGLYYCPVCYKNGKKVVARSCCTSETYPANIHRLNMPGEQLQNSVGKNCYVCDVTNYCSKFGKFDYQCSRSDFDYCECKTCCIQMKKDNLEQSKKLEELIKNKCEY